MRLAATSELISSQHQARYAAHYAQQRSVLRPPKWLPLIEYVATEIGAQSVLDYGCGLEGNLAWYSTVPVTNYDPGVPQWAARPGQQVDLVVCLHVLEHVEQKRLDAVLLDLLWYARTAALLIVSCQPSSKTLSDGTPWHTCVHEADWWREVLDQTLTLYGVPFRVERLPAQLYQETPKEYGCLLLREKG